MKVKNNFSTTLCWSVLSLMIWSISSETAGQAHEFNSSAVFQQVELKRVTGVVLDDKGQPLAGASIMEEGTHNLVITDSEGRFTIDVTSNTKVIVMYMGFMSQTVAAKTGMIVRMCPDVAMLEELVVIGYGVQKKESTVGSISSVKSEAIMQNGGVTTVSQTLQGKLPGVVTLYTSGEPGTDDVEIYIRGQSSWNNAGNPLVLVDGVERSMSDVNIADVESISVLKDASATAVYGVKGANGVILITSKRGQKGQAAFNISANTTMKTISKVPEKYDSYDGMMIMNEAVMNELAYNPAVWNLVTPQAIADRYRNQETLEEFEKYPNVDWKDYMFRDIVSDYQVNASVRGGNNFAKYFCSVGYLRENDIVKNFDANRGYQSGNHYDRFNYRANLDLDITNTTQLSLNLTGISGIKVGPYYKEKDKERMFLSLYGIAPDLYCPMYEDGSFGFAPSKDFGQSNSVMFYSSMGSNTDYMFKVNADIKLTQNLNFITKGLSVHARFTMDNSMNGRQSILDRTDNGVNAIQKYYDPKTEQWVYEYPNSSSPYAFSSNPWSISSFTVGSGKRRLIDYEAAVNYARSFERHSVSALALFKRQQFAVGNMFPEYNEDWVFRVTYDYAKRYLIEINGAYNGSEKFGPGYRFDFFPSVGIGWMLSNEKFLKGIRWIDRLKLRASAGLVGDDNFTSQRWLYMSQWNSMNTFVAMNNPGFFWDHKNRNAKSPYQNYAEAVMGNKDIHWEESFKQDYGLEYSFLNGRISGEFDCFLDNRNDIFIPGNMRAINDFIGIRPPGANIGKVNVHGYEFILKLFHSLGSDVSIYCDLSFTHAKDKILYRDDPQFRPDYQKQAGFSIGQMRAPIAGEIMQNWDDVYMSTPLAQGDEMKRVGYYDVVDFNGDGNYYGINDNAPYGYPTRPQNTWTVSFGGEWKGLSVAMQLFGQFNSTRSYILDSFSQNSHLFFKNNGNYWSKGNSSVKLTLPAIQTRNATMDPYRNLVDASIVRLKMVEVAYKLPQNICKRVGLKGLKVFFNGNNLFLWSQMADDRDFGGGNRGGYPTLRRFNFGLNLNL